MATFRDFTSTHHVFTAGPNPQLLAFQDVVTGQWQAAMQMTRDEATVALNAIATIENDHRKIDHES